MKYELRLIMTAQTSQGAKQLANIRITGGDYAFVSSARDDAVMRFNEPMHPLSRIDAFVRAMNNEYGLISTALTVNVVDK